MSKRPALPLIASIRYSPDLRRAQARDAEMDQLIELILASGLELDEIALNAQQRGESISPYTILSWLYGRVGRPQNAKVNALLAGLGKKR